MILSIKSFFYFNDFFIYNFSYEIRDKIAEIHYKKNVAKITIFKNTADLMNAIHWLPPNPYLWSGKLPMKYVGLFGVISTLLGIMLVKYQPSAPQSNKSN